MKEIGESTVLYERGERLSGKMGSGERGRWGEIAKLRGRGRKDERDRGKRGKNREEQKERERSTCTYICITGNTKQGSICTFVCGFIIT